MNLGSDSRPKFKGLTVPWVTRWEGEKDRDTRLGIFSGIFIDERTDEALPLNILVYQDHVADGDATDSWFQDRDEDGILWLRDNGPQDGPPEFSQVHALRQSQAMRQALCQVCGGQLDKERTPWLMSEAQLGLASREGASMGKGPCTGNPPTCEPCQQAALAQCPHLKYGARRFVVTKYRLDAVFGDKVVVEDGEPRLEKTTVLVEDKQTLAMIARQMVVEWLEYEEIPWP